MPIGVIVNALSVVVGGVIGAAVGGKLSSDFKDKINMIFGCCSMSMGISTIALVIHLGDKINAGGRAMQRFISKFIKSTSSNISQEEFEATLITVVVLFCASGTGIYGSIVSGMTGDHSILIAKSILDLFTALIFACILGGVVSVIAIPQFIIFLLLFLAAGFIFPMTTDTMIADFKACGGFLMLATGFRMIKVKMFPTADMIPAMAIVMPCRMLAVNLESQESEIFWDLFLCIAFFLDFGYNKTSFLPY